MKNNNLPQIKKYQYIGKNLLRSQILKQNQRNQLQFINQFILGQNQQQNEVKEQEQQLANNNILENVSTNFLKQFSPINEIKTIQEPKMKPFPNQNLCMNLQQIFNDQNNKKINSQKQKLFNASQKKQNLRQSQMSYGKSMIQNDNSPNSEIMQKITNQGVIQNNNMLQSQRENGNQFAIIKNQNYKNHHQIVRSHDQYAMEKILKVKKLKQMNENYFKKNSTNQTDTSTQKVQQKNMISKEIQHKIDQINENKQINKLEVVQYLAEDFEENNYNEEIDITNNQSENEIEDDQTQNIISSSVNIIQLPSNEQQKQPLLYKNGSKKVWLQHSIYEGRPPTIFFQYPQVCKQYRSSAFSYEVSQDKAEKFDLKFYLYKYFQTLQNRFKYPTKPYNCIVNSFKAAGFQPTDGNKWLGFIGNVSIEKVSAMNKYQKINHFPGLYHIGRKDNLWRHISKKKRKFPLDYNFIPKTYLLATEYERFKFNQDQAKKTDLWILKPVANACGRGIRMIHKKSKLTRLRKKDFLISEYISNPHLINGFKYDLRIYVLVSCFDPLRIYIYNEGLVRFCTLPYNKNIAPLVAKFKKKQKKCKIEKINENDSVSQTKSQPILKTSQQRYSHLTNYSVNKNNPLFIKNQDQNQEDGYDSSKWALSALQQKYQEMGIDVKKLWKNIEDVIIKTLIATEGHISAGINKISDHRNNCFELYGFDILIDEKFKPWLMEVNVSPSFASSSALDKRIKTSLWSDTFHLIGFQPIANDEIEVEKRLSQTIVEDKKGSKMISKIIDLNESNCLQKLSKDDWNVLLETDEEFIRKSNNFKRIYPDKETINYYEQFFDIIRYNNFLVKQWLLCPTNLIKKLYKINPIYQSLIQ